MNKELVAIAALLPLIRYRDPVNRRLTPEEAEALRMEADIYKARVSSPPPATGRNAPCPCGSGSKYKRCCMKTLAVPGRNN